MKHKPFILVVPKNPAVAQAALAILQKFNMSVAGNEDKFSGYAAFQINYQEGVILGHNTGVDTSWYETHYPKSEIVLASSQLNRLVEILSQSIIVALSNTSYPEAIISPDRSHVTVGCSVFTREDVKNIWRAMQ